MIIKDYFDMCDISTDLGKLTFLQNVKDSYDQNRSLYFAVLNAILRNTRLSRLQLWWQKHSGQSTASHHDLYNFLSSNLPELIQQGELHNVDFTKPYWWHAADNKKRYDAIVDTIKILQKRIYE